jgi:SagB-type dehydrogenase family enzyme
MMNLTREEYRYFLKDAVRLNIDFRLTDQSRGVEPPPIEQPVPAGSKRIELASPGSWKGIAGTDLLTAIRDRRSCRQFSRDPVTLDALSFLLWATQGITAHAGGATAFRTVPSAGCRHALETYLAVLNVDGLQEGIYRYLPVEHQLAELSHPADLPRRLAGAALQQQFIARSAVTFVWTAVPYRMEWRYGLAAHKVIAIDAGHVCQNLYLACTAAGCGTCAVAAYHQELMDGLLGVDGEEEFTLYLAPVGRLGG